MVLTDWSEKAAVGFEPTNNGFANRRLRPLGYAANTKKNVQLLYTKDALFATKFGYFASQGQIFCNNFSAPNVYYYAVGLYCAEKTAICLSA